MSIEPKKNECTESFQNGRVGEFCKIRFLKGGKKSKNIGGYLSKFEFVTQRSKKYNHKTCIGSLDFHLCKFKPPF
jgi:hypothetical protein